MDAERSPGRGCLRKGCLACLSCLGLLFLIALVLGVVSLILGPPVERVVERRLQQEPPAAATAETAERPARALPPAGERDETVAVGRVVLDVSMAEFEIVPGPPRTPIVLEARYDDGSFELTESLETRDDASWTYRLEFGLGVTWLRKLHVESENRLRLVLPRDTPLTLEGNVGMGRSSLELGGLDVLSIDLRAGMGEHGLGFSEPLPAPLQHLEWVGSLGETALVGLGNASPREVRVRHGMGELRLDLAGNWRTDADVRAYNRVGALEVTVPDAGPEIRVERARVSLGDSSVPGLRGRKTAPGAPVVRLQVAAAMGEVSVRR